MRKVKEDELLSELYDTDQWTFKMYYNTGPKDVEKFRAWWHKISTYGFVPDEEDIKKYAKENGYEFSSNVYDPKR